MSDWMIWISVGAVMMLLELILPGGVIVFLGLASISVGALVYLGLIKTIIMALIAWFIISLVYIFILRAFFIKYFEGDSIIQNVDEDEDIIGALVEVVEEVLPYKEGRVRFRDSTWSVRSDEEIKLGTKAVVIKRDGSKLVIKSIDNLEKE
jgi:membrane protein implicated in regulation of membrane protease activity